MRLKPKDSFTYIYFIQEIGNHSPIQLFDKLLYSYLLHLIFIVDVHSYRYVPNENE